MCRGTPDDGSISHLHQVRIKVQDDNDLKAAYLALKSCAEFFENLTLYATRHSVAETAVLPMLEAGF